MKLNIKKFAGDTWGLTTSFSDYKYNANGELIQVTLTITSTYNVSSIYDIDNEDNEIYNYSSWENHYSSDSYPHTDMPYIRRTFYNLNNLKGVKLVTYESPNTQTQIITYNFKMGTGEEQKTTYLTKTSATAVLKGNVVNNLSTYDWNNAPSIGAVRNYIESGSVVQSQKEWLKDLILETTHPIGSLEINTSGINPSEYLGGGWESFGSGRTLVGVDSSDSDFDTAEETGGEKTHTLTINEIPAHTHGSKSLVGTWANWGEGSGMVSSSANGYKVTGIVSAVGDNNQYGWGTSTGRDQDNTSLKIDATHEHNSVGGSQAHNNLQPYITVYFWKRIS